ncbi:hypothetical protein P5673_000751 [Acropora cervicornis]|uniref:Uncharacterized protein n=1 Tax=Acropora cervicornis TaxID=6130 RepID=A0AAD9VHE4_ACRCE|nr:hypothetical protein P5673_000751 [Acropora cervicornis]
MFKGITNRPHSSTTSSQSEWTQTLNSELDLSAFGRCLRKKDNQKLHQAEEKEQQQIQPIRIQDKGPVITITMRRCD